MTQILFFDTDTELTDFARTCPIAGAESIFFTESLNTISPTQLAPYQNAEVISLFVHSESISNAQLDLLPHLKLIATRSTGFNHIDLAYCRQRGITVVNVPRYGEVTVAEFAFGLLLALSRKVIVAGDDMFHNRIMVSNYVGFDLCGKTIGVIGTGSIGRHMIQLAQGFGMKVLAYDPYHNPALTGLYVQTLDEIYQQADVISLHIPSTPENYHLIDKKAFAKMKKGVLIINTARGDLIDTQALYHALRQGIVGGAGLDVLENEDFLLHDEVSTTDKMTDRDFLLDSAMNLKIMQFRNVIVTPHIAFNSIDAIHRILKITFDNIQSFIVGQVQNQVG